MARGVARAAGRGWPMGRRWSECEAVRGAGGVPMPPACGAGGRCRGFPAASRAGRRLLHGGTEAAAARLAKALTRVNAPGSRSQVAFPSGDILARLPLERPQRRPGRGVWLPHPPAPQSAGWFLAGVWAGGGRKVGVCDTEHRIQARGIGSLGQPGKGWVHPRLSTTGPPAARC